MADENFNTGSSPEESGAPMTFENRRYVGRKETVGFVLWDAAQSFNISSKYGDRFITNIVQIDLKLQLINQTINGIWDIVNDMFMGVIVDKTRTRWGKFKPYLLLLAFPGLVGTMLYWLMPVFFAGRTSMDLTKFFFYLILSFVNEGVGTFQQISRTGLLSTITPHPIDRTRLITIATFASGQFGEKLPEQLMTVLLDFIDRGFFKTPKNILYNRSFIGMGLFTTVVSGAMSFWFFLNSRERVLQSVEKPSLKQGFRSIANNKPVLLLTLSKFLSAFSIGGSKQDYYIDVLHFASMTLVAGIPAAPISPASYLYVPWLREHFSSRFLYITCSYVSNFVLVFVFLFGCIGMNRKTKAGGLYQKTIPMMIAMMIWEIIWTLFYGCRNVIETELYNESMDYCEWKNGYRTEAMTSVARELAQKIASKVSSFISTALKDYVRYDQSAYVAGQEQTDSVKFWLFAMFTVVPSVTGLLGIFPMLFYDLDGDKKKKMYDELLARRAAAQKAADKGDAEALAEVAKAQMSE